LGSFSLTNRQLSGPAQEALVTNCDLAAFPSLQVPRLVYTLLKKEKLRSHSKSVQWHCGDIVYPWDDTIEQLFRAVITEEDFNTSLISLVHDSLQSFNDIEEAWIHDIRAMDIYVWLCVLLLLAPQLVTLEVSNLYELDNMGEHLARSQQHGSMQNLSSLKLEGNEGTSDILFTLLRSPKALELPALKTLELKAKRGDLFEKDDFDEGGEHGRVWKVMQVEAKKYEDTCHVEKLILRSNYNRDVY
jgi:hypothetical protein